MTIVCVSLDHRGRCSFSPYRLPIGEFPEDFVSWLWGWFQDRSSSWQALSMVLIKRASFRVASTLFQSGMSEI